MIAVAVNINVLDLHQLLFGYAWGINADAMYIVFAIIVTSFRLCESQQDICRCIVILKATQSGSTIARVSLN
jgi:hypothetical protein